MRVLIIGYGSIGKRHEEVLLNSKIVSEIHIVSKQTLFNKIAFKSLENIENLNSYDYFVIASETYKHYEQLQYIDSKVNGKLIFCEKPLFDKKSNLKISNNKVFVGYVLRFHPLLLKLKNELNTQKILSININCGQYLPSWRQNIDYRTSYSAKKDQGGGVLLDLSHEIDYLQWLVGPIESIKSIQDKISDLEINTDDFVTFIGKSNKITKINLSIDYISKITHRKILINTLEYTYEIDLIKSKLLKVDKKGNEDIIEVEKLERNFMFTQMHNDIFTNKKNICTYEEALDVMETINIIQEQNK